MDNLYLNDVGDEVMVVQRLLNMLDNAGLAQDGIYGPLTQGALSTYQQGQNLSEMAFCGPLTWAALLSEGRSKTPSPVQNILEQIPGSILQDAFHCAMPIATDGASSIGDTIFDTGSFETVINGAIAEGLDLPNLGSLTLDGVSGNAQAYQSQITMVLGNQTYPDQPCVVDPSYTGSDALWGLKFFIDNQLHFTLDPIAATLSIMEA